MGKIVQKFISFNSLESTNINDKIKTSFRNCIFYFTFLTLTIIITIGNIRWYWFTEMINHEITNNLILDNSAEIHLSEVSNLEETWLGINNALSDSFLWNYWYFDSGITMKNEKLINTHLIGLPQLRQVRIKNNTCSIPMIFKSHFNSCYGIYSSNNKDITSHKINNGWAYHENDEPSYKGEVGTYDSGGFYEELNYNKMKTLSIVFFLKEYLWIDRQTRAIFLEFTVYNVNINTVCVVKIVFEVLPCGGVIVTPTFTNIKLVPYLTHFDCFILTCEIFFFLYLVYYSQKTVLEIKLRKRRYFSQIWNYIDIFILILGFIYIIMKVVCLIFNESLLNDTIYHGYRYINFGHLVKVHHYFVNLCGILLFVVFIKIFRFVRYCGFLGQLNATLHKSAADIFTYLFTFMLFFIGFAILGYLLFGAKMKSFHTIIISMCTLFKAVHSEFQYDEIIETTTGRIFFFVFVFIIFFLLINMFLAIIEEAYQLVQRQLLSEDTNNAKKFFRRGGYRIFSFYKPIQNLFLMPKSKEVLNFKLTLKMAQYKEDEIQLFQEKFGIDKKNDISKQYAKKFFKDIKKHGYHPHEAADYIRSKHAPVLNNLTNFASSNIMLEEMQRNVNELTSLLKQLSVKKV